MDITEYQENISQFIDYHKELGPFQLILRLSNNVGILSNKLYNILNTTNGEFTDEEKIKIAISLGDILQDIANMASDLNITLDEVIALNIKKIELSQRNKNANS